MPSNLILLCVNGLMLGTQITVFLDLDVQALGGYAKPLGYFTGLIASIRDLLNCLNFKFFCVAFSAHI